MEERKRQSYYVDGNTVRKIAVPVEEPQRREERRPERKQGHRRTYRQSEGLEMSLSYVAFLFVMVIIIVTSCVRYLDINSQISKTNMEISKAQTVLDTLVTKNDAVEYEIDSYIDVEYIMNTAKEQLGMIVAGSEQVKFYDASDSEYMNQLNDVKD
ncbi:MAG: hypothetical protein IJV71_06025 [Lachnospiraceae bacterium]|nr:hypothetical protein [Lachnospiraceae bacterium]